MIKPQTTTKRLLVVAAIIGLALQLSNFGQAAEITQEQFDALLKVVQEQNKKIDALTEKVRVLEQREQTASTNVPLQQLPAIVIDTNGVPVGTTDARTEQLEKKISVLEQEQKDEKQAAAERSKTAPRVSIGAEGFTFSAADTNFVLRFRGILQVDSRTFLNDGGIPGNSGFLLRRARPILTGTVFRDFDFLFMPDFGTSANGGNQTTPSIFEAWLNGRYSKELQMRVGKFRPPVDLEYLALDSELSFNERAFPTQLSPLNDLGVQLHGQVWNRMSYVVGMFNGVGDNRNSTGSDFDDDKALGARLFFEPWKVSDIEPLQGLGFGVGGSYESAFGVAGLPNTTGGTTPGYATDGQQQFFAYKNNVVAAGQHWRLAPQMYYYYGPFSLMSEYALSTQQISFTDLSRTANVQNKAWHITAGWVLTGEKASYRGVTPSAPFKPSAGQWGAWQLVARYERLDLDPRIFSQIPLLSFADPEASAHGARAFSTGVNWWLNKNVRVNASFSHTWFEGGGIVNPLAPLPPGPPLSVTRQDENTIFTRVQLAF